MDTISESALFDRDTQIRLAIVAIGFSPIASLAISIFHVIPLHFSGPFIVLPAAMGALVLGSIFPQYAQTLIRGFTLGLVAVFFYDVTCRFPFIATGIWSDFIPKIGDYLLDRHHVHWVVGYLWRYLGNGGGMGLAFYAGYPLVRKYMEPLRAGLTYGVLIFCCLLITLYLSPYGRVSLFQPTLVTGTLGLLGHLVYGSVLGYGVRQLPETAASEVSEPVLLRKTSVHTWS